MAASVEEAVRGTAAGAAVPEAPIPSTFGEYLRAMGPGLVVVLTWLGAGDIVDAAVSGASYGYALMWVLALALLIRWLFVSTIAKYALCNQHGESVLQGLKRLSPAYPPFIFAATVLLSHIVGIYMYQGLGESSAALAGGGAPWVWAVGWGIAFYLLVRRPVFRQIEAVFLVFLGILSVSLIGAALWSGPNIGGIVRGTIGFQMPVQRGDFHPHLVAISLVGAVAGSLANLMYPYFIREKGWTTPAHRKVQRYDLALGVIVIILLDLAVWVVGAEVLHPRGYTVDSIHDLAKLLSLTLGHWGGMLIYLGVFAAVGSSVVGNAMAYSYIATDAYLLWRPGKSSGGGDYRLHPGYRWMVLWTLFSPLPWVISGTTSFVALTVAVNAFQVLLLPVLAGGMWVLTAHQGFIGAKYRNGWWENLAMGVFFAMSLLGAAGSISSLVARFGH
jgi:Mn2+/Fe2+ NRAMP family transporter